jgi:hypothetical protein
MPATTPRCDVAARRSSQSATHSWSNFAPRSIGVPLSDGVTHSACPGSRSRVNVTEVTLSPARGDCKRSPRCRGTRLAPNQHPEPPAPVGPTEDEGEDDEEYRADEAKAEQGDGKAIARCDARSSGGEAGDAIGKGRGATAGTTEW